MSSGNTIDREQTKWIGYRPRWEDDPGLSQHQTVLPVPVLSSPKAKEA